MIQDNNYTGAKRKKSIVYIKIQNSNAACKVLENILNVLLITVWQTLLLLQWFANDYHQEHLELN